MVALWMPSAAGLTSHLQDLKKTQQVREPTGLAGLDMLRNRALAAQGQPCSTRVVTRGDTLGPTTVAFVYCCCCCPGACR